MRSFRNLPIKWKLTLVMVLISSTAVAMLSLTLFFTGLVRLRDLAVQEAAGLAGIIGRDCADALAAGDANTARKELDDLAAWTTIEEACLYTADGREFARYTRHDMAPRPPPPIRESGECFAGNHLELFRPIEHHGKRVGMIHLRADTRTNWARIKRFVGVSIVATAVLALAVLVFASWLEQFLFSSIRELIRVARGVTERKDFTLRAARLSEDETGVLTDAFNQMLGIIQERDSDSRASQNRLEKGVQERTRQLEDSNARLKTEMTGRKHAEESLRRLAQFPEETPNPVLRIAEDDALLYANAPAQAWLAALGSGAGQPLPVAVRALVADARRQGRVVEAEIADDSSRVFWFAAIKPRGEDYVNLYGRDVTGRKQAEAALAGAKRALERERDILQAVMNGAKNSHLVYLDRDFNFVRVNETYAQTCGYRPEQMIGRNHFALYPNKENEAIFARVRDTGEPVACHDKPFEFADQPERGVTYWDWTLSPAKAPDGHVDGLVFSLFETTERKRTEEALAQFNAELETRVQRRTTALVAENIVRKQAEEKVKTERQRFYDVLETLPAYVVLLTPDHHVAFANRFFRERFGESHGRRCYEYLFHRTEPCETCESYTALKTRAPHHWEWAGPDGCNYDIHDFLFTDTDGSPLILEMGIDITARKQMQEELHASQEQLRALTARLQATREEERTRVAREIHDVLAQELTRLKMGLAWLRRSLSEPNKAATPETLAVRISEMSQMTDAAIRCVQEIATELRPAVLDSLGLCAAVEWQARDFCDDAGIQCQVSVPEQEFTVDREAATAAFRILQEGLTNVQRHAKATRVDVLLRQEAGQLILRVQDNGCGVRSEALTSAQSIGLVGMRERAMLLGGQFKIWSQLGSGTTIEVRLPLLKQESLPEGNS